jgi:hypothetical protein
MGKFLFHVAVARLNINAIYMWKKDLLAGFVVHVYIKNAFF